MGARAVVFAYHDVGVRCLSVLLAHGVEVVLVVTHDDDPRENVWFGSVERLARDNDIDVAKPARGDDPGLAQRVAAAAPDFIFSFYYRHMLPASLLAAAPRGAFNMHGSLLPNYRGRAPVNWAVLRGERETGATLHEMVAKPDAGRIADQMAVPILPDDLAIDVFRKVTVAAEIVLDRTLPKLLDGSARLVPQDLARGGYFGGRKPEDGRIDWTRPAREIHDLVRAVAPPYPGAFTDLRGQRLRVLRTRIAPSPGTGHNSKADVPCPPESRGGGPRLVLDRRQRLTAHCIDGHGLVMLETELDGKPLTASTFQERFGRDGVPLGEPA